MQQPMRLHMCTCTGHVHTPAVRTIAPCRKVLKSSVAMYRAPVPKRVDAVKVHNQTGQPVKVTVTYTDSVSAPAKDEHVTVEVPAGATHHFEEKQVDQGSWQAIAPITSIKTPDHKLEPSVNGVVKVLDVHLTDNGLKQAH